jgi:hypothetical protein
VYPDSLNPDLDTDPDPAYQVNPYPGFMTKNGRKKIQLKIFFFVIYLSLGLHKGLPSYRRSLQP